MGRGNNAEGQGQNGNIEKSRGVKREFHMSFMKVPRKAYGSCDKKKRIEKMTNKSSFNLEKNSRKRENNLEKLREGHVPLTCLRIYIYVCSFKRKARKKDEEQVPRPFGQGMKKKRKEKKNFKPSILWFKNYVLQVFLPSQGCSLMWCNCWSKKTILCGKFKILVKWEVKEKGKISCSFMCYEWLCMLQCMKVSEIHGEHGWLSVAVQVFVWYGSDELILMQYFNCCCYIIYDEMNEKHEKQKLWR